MALPDKPTITCLVAYPWRDGEYVVWGQPVSLELAAALKAVGWAVLVDPMTERDLATWERVAAVVALTPSQEGSHED